VNHEHFFKKLEEENMLVNDISSLGWGFWPSKGGGYFDEHTLRILADEIEQRNKPFWDEYEEYCRCQDLTPLTEDESLVDTEFVEVLLGNSFSK
jgi:hypothetical protein